MRKVSIWWLIFLGTGYSVAQDLTVSLRINEQEFCGGMPDASMYKLGGELAPDAISLDLAVTVAYHNGAAVPAIFMPRRDLLVVISRNPADAAARRGQTVFPTWEWGQGPRYQPEDLAVLDVERPESRFPMIPPGGEYSEDIPLSFQVHKPSAAGTGGEFLGKTIYFQLDVDHRYIPENIKSHLSAK